MSTSPTEREDIVTPQFTMCFPCLYEPRAAVEGAEPKYSCTGVFPKGTDLSVLKNQVKKLLVEKFPDGNVPSNLRLPFLDGNQALKDHPAWGEVYKDAIYIRFTTTRQPKVIDRRRADITDSDKVWGGQIARAIVNVYYYSKAGNRGIGFGLKAVQVVADGERLGVNPEAYRNMFDQLEGEDDAADNDPFKGLDL